MAFRVC
jgi:hypothetical protein